MCIALVCNNRVAGVFVDVLVMLHAVCLLFQMGLHAVLDSYFVFFSRTMLLSSRDSCW